MHAWQYLNGYPNVSPKVEEGICQVLVHMWLDSKLIAGSCSSCEKGKRSQFERKLDEFFKHQIESDGSMAYGDGFRRGTKAARQGIVPLQIKAGALLLFATAIKSLVVIGPNARVIETLIRNYEVTPGKYTTPLQGLSAWT
ncbi:hypothetical protein Nepgr_019738 [Nepenthes gracilis]|uniref:Protein DA1-like domain-containing protein n=1 Tax=Nepenthes gracilis TaxID=150966 RepID=A0AAD3SWL3_NEPGR|nr:hypothetical protein Nepgr_019738 [Nepenthes gracilis]